MPVAAGVGVEVETVSLVEPEGVGYDSGKGDADRGGEAVEHPKVSAKRTVVVAFAEICLKVGVAQISSAVINARSQFDGESSSIYW